MTHSELVLSRLARRAIEDRSYGLEDDLAELAGIKADLMLAVGRMDKLIKRLDGNLCGNVEDAASMVQDEVVNGRLFLAEQAIRGVVPDLDDIYPGRSR